MKVKGITAKDFGKRMARTMLKIPSSHAFFFIQQAYGKPPYGADMSWKEAEEILKIVAKEK
jgi:hypothetical protein